MYKLFIPESIPGVQKVPYLHDCLQKGNRLFQDLRPDAYRGLYEDVSDITLSDIVMAPHEYVELRKYPSHLARYLTQAQEANKLLLISAYQDDPAPIDIPGTIILRPSAYKTILRSNEILMPAYVEDLGEKSGWDCIEKNEKPRISFVGKANFSTWREHLKYLLRNYIVRSGAHRQGVYFRRKALSSLRLDARVILNAIIRKNYSGHRNTIEISPTQAREEYIRSIQDAHFTLAPRGDGNYSLRFYETLSLGRIPVIIDTDMPLPLEDRIDYAKCIVRVPWQESHRVGDYVSAFFASHTDEQLRMAQRQARNIFETYLYMPRFLEILFTDILPERTRQPH